MKSSEVNRPGQRAFVRAAAAVGLALVAASASAGTNRLTVDVAPLAPKNPAGDYSVSYSGVKAALGQSLNAAYLVTIKNETTSNVNNAWFKVQTSINNGQGPAFLTPLPDNCTVDSQVAPLGSGLVCLFALPAQVPPASVSFDLVIPTPNAPNSGQDSSLKLLWTVQAGQGNSDSNPSNIVKQASPTIILSLNSSAGLRSYVLKDSGFKVAVGNSNTLVTPPRNVPVDLQQAIENNSCSSMFKKCFKSTLSIINPLTNLPESFNDTPLFVDLIREKSTLKGSADINNLNGTLIYTGATTYQINACDVTLPGPTFSIPEGAERCYIPATPANTFTFIDGAGNWHIRVLGRTNGIINW